jgi:hypothetical protein
MGRIMRGMDLYRPRSYHDDARRLTEELRTSDKPQWKAVRRFLTDTGFDPQESAVGDLFPEQPGDFGVLVTAERRVFTFEVGWEPVRAEQGKRRWWVTHSELVNAEDRFAYAPAAFAAMSLLEKERPSGIRPIAILVEYLTTLTDKFRGTAVKRWAERWDAEDYWEELYEFLRDRSIDPMETVALAWAWTADEIDGGLMDVQGCCYHFSGTLETLNGPIGEVTAWDALDLTNARAIYGDLVDAALELLRPSRADS